MICALSGLERATDDATVVLAGCHELLLVDGSVTGDPMEKAAMRWIGWGITASGYVVKKRANKQGDAGDRRRLRIVRTFPFTSALRRMCTIVDVDGEEGMVVLAKGAPEVIEGMLGEVPEGYSSAYRALMSDGHRVIALAHGAARMSKEDALSMSRESAECELNFAGFLLLGSPLKDDTKRVIGELLASRHEVIVITGDNALTACSVAREAGIVDAQPTIFESPMDTKDIERAAAIEGPLCATGTAIASLDAPSLQRLAPRIAVFARTTPKQKERVIGALRANGTSCLMCGDGTNDVGALRCADVGVSIINSPDMEKSMRKAKRVIEKRIAKTGYTPTLAERLPRGDARCERGRRCSSCASWGCESCISFHEQVS